MKGELKMISYITDFREEKRALIKEYKKYKNVIFGKTNNFVIINGVTYNGITKELFEKLTKED